MSWCDKLASTPAVGFKLDPYVASGDALVDALAPVLNGFVKKDSLGITIEKHETTAIVFNTDAGLRYGVEAGRVHITFNHRLHTKQGVGGVPTLEMLSVPQPYTELLPEVQRRLIEATLLLPEIKTRKVLRIGIVTQTTVAEDEVPPGITKLINYFGRPWSGKTKGFSISFHAEIATGDGVTDTCVHNLTMPEEEDALLQMNFDWGRTFEEGKPSDNTTLNRMSDAARSAALAYFEELAEGNRFDERLISEKS